jgi:effector-binding domain-containing protein
MTMTVEIPENALADKETAPFTALCFTTRTTLATISDWNHVAGELFTEAAQLGLAITGPIQYVYTGVTGNETNEFQLEIALPIAASADSAGTFIYKNFADFQCVSYTYVGHWENLPAVYDALFGQLYGGGRKNDGHVREVYINVDSAKPETCVTEIQIGLA